MAISFDKFKKIFLYDCIGECCIEARLVFDGNYFFVGKSADNTYWSGAPYTFETADFNKFCEFIESMWVGIEVVDIDGCEPSERIDFYLK